MRGSLSARIATVVLVLALAMPAMAAPSRDDSPLDPIDRIERRISNLFNRIISIFDLSQNLDPPK